MICHRAGGWARGADSTTQHDVELAPVGGLFNLPRMETSKATSGAISDLTLFLKSLAEEGRVAVSPGPLTEGDAGATDVLRLLDEFARHELATAAPQFSPGTALWAARLFYQLCQFTVCRDLDEEQITAACAAPCPEPRGPEADWSADLLFRHLPRLFQLARHLSHADPLLQQMKRIAVTWPLSSVGIPGLLDLRLESFIGQPALRRLYGDRILASGDLSRLGDARVDDLLRADLGVHREFSPAVAACLFPNHDPH